MERNKNYTEIAQNQLESVINDKFNNALRIVSRVAVGFGFASLLLAVAYRNHRENSNISETANSILEKTHGRHWVDEINKCDTKKVKITKFCTFGDVEGEHRVTLDFKSYYPTSRNSQNCPQDKRNYCDWPLDTCWDLGNYARWVPQPFDDRLWVGVKAFDAPSYETQNIYLTTDQWHSSTCKNYELRITKYFHKKNRKPSSVCWNNDFFVPRDKTTCSEPENVPDSYVWIVQVKVN